MQPKGVPKYCIRSCLLNNNILNQFIFNSITWELASFPEKYCFIMRTVIYLVINLYKM